ncbi:SPFH domain-containing protein [Thermopirellula anaerolimosa]
MGIRMEVIQFLDETNRSLVQRVPPEGTADIKIGAQLIVYENQEAIFFRDGKALDRFGPGRYTLTTANVPLITRLLTIPWEKSPFQCSVYFIGKQVFLDQKWGTRQPIVFRDPQFGMIRLRSFGKYSFRVRDAEVLVNTLVGTQGKYTTEEVTAFLKDLVVARLTDLLGSLQMGILDLPAKYDEVASGTRAKVALDFTKYGLELVDFFINAITPPDEVQRMIDTRSGMAAVGDLNSFLKYQMAQSLTKMAEKGGEASGAMGMGYGAGFGMMMPGMMQQAMREAAAPAPQTGGPAGQVPLGGVPGALPTGTAMTPGIVESPIELTPAAPDKEAMSAMIRSTAEAARHTVEPHEAGLRITVSVRELRKQFVYVEFVEPTQEHGPFVRFWSVCGPAGEKNAAALLRYNARLLYGAFAFHKVGGQDMIVLQANVLTEGLTPAEVSRILSAIAWQADAVEQRLTGQDTL